MKIALVNQPLGHILLPTGERPLRSSSIGLWHYHVATRWPGTDEVTVYSRSPAEDRTVDAWHGGARFKGIAVRLDVRCQEHSARLRRFRNRIGRPEDPCRPYFLSPLYYLGYLLRIGRDLRRTGCEVIHIANFPQFAPVLRALAPRVKIILHMHCEWLTALDAETIDRHLRSCDRVSGCSRYLVQGIERRFPQHAPRCYTLPNGVDTELFRPGEPPAEENPEIVFISRISPEKGVHILLEAFAEVIKQIPRARLTLIGSHVPAPREFIVGVDPDPLVRALGRFYEHGPGGYLTHLRALAAPFASQVTFISRLPQADLLPAYQRATLFVFPSVCHEAFGMPPAEAMACGVPVVATRSGGLPEVVEEGRTGLLVERGNAKALASAILALLHDPARRRAMGAAGRERVLQRFTWRHVAQSLRQRMAETLHPLPESSGEAPVGGTSGN